MYSFLQRSLVFFFLLVFAGVYPLTAQTSCACPEFEKLSGDKQAVEKLLALPSAVCKAMGCEQTAKELLKRKEFDSAAIFLDKAMAYYGQNNCGEASLITVYKLYTNLYSNKADFPAALGYNLKILALVEKSGNRSDMANGRLVVADVFNRMKQLDKAIQYTRNSIPLVTGLPSSAQKADLLNKITARYLFYAKEKPDEKYNDTAETFVQQALAISREVKDIKGEIIALTRMNDIAGRKKDFIKALEYIDEALPMCRMGEHNSQLATLYGDKGDALMQLGNYKEAKRYADSFLFYCRLDAYPPMIANAWNLLYEIENKAGNYQAAMYAQQQETKIRDSITTAERTKAVAELEKKYSQSQNEKTIRELAQQKQIYGLLALAGLLALILVGFFLRQQHLKHNQKILETEQRLNRARMNPHFFFNALSTLQSIALKDNDGKALAGNLSKFSHIMRETLESTYKDYVTIEQESQFLNEYLELQKIRFPEKFTYSVHAEEELETEELLIPSMILQPFVENSIEHGFSGIAYPGHVSVFFSQENEQLLITITDNGKGLLKTDKDNNEHISRASQIIRDRIYLLNIKLKSKAGFSIENNPAGVGVMAKIILPAMYKS
jgi:tetratricopeptide (TPR) repeat protein